MAVHRNKTSEIETITEDQFLEDVIEGLSSRPKFISSKYFYDQRGDELFVQITKLPEYYLTRSEDEILADCGRDIANHLGIINERCKVIELGPGNGEKAISLLSWARLNRDLTFIPIDISYHTLSKVIDNFNDQIPGIHVHAKSGEYFDALGEIPGEEKKIVLFLGSNIGNMNEAEATEFMTGLSQNLDKGDLVLLGVDLKKDPSIILPAYDDSQGITSAFNLNLLKRANVELGANFDTSAFEHVAEYDHEMGEARSYLKSLVDQDVIIGSSDRLIAFKENEMIHTERSQKYDDEKLRLISKNASLEIKKKFLDQKGYFAEYILEKI